MDGQATLPVRLRLCAGVLTRALGGSAHTAPRVFSNLGCCALVPKEAIMLHEFLAANRDEIIRRCRWKVSKRDSPPVNPAELEYGVPLFLEQLVEALRCGTRETTPGALESSRTAALHGEELLLKGYSVDQVVHGYGDICQAVTELAGEAAAPITVEEFHTFNRLLDNAIADAVSAYGRHLDDSAADPADPGLHQRMGALADEQRTLLDTALKALAALKAGNIGLRGATGIVLEESLIKLRDLVDKSLPEIRLAAGMTAPPRAGQGA
jgi:hypothetical protein